MNKKEKKGLGIWHMPLSLGDYTCVVSCGTAGTGTGYECSL